MSLIKIGFPEYPIIDGVSDHQDSYLYSLYSSLYGERRNYFRSLNDVTAYAWVLDFSDPFAIDFCYVARADRLVAAGLSQILVSRSTDSVTYNTEFNQTSFTLTGKDNQDWLKTFARTSAYRYWRSSIAISSNKATFSKFYLGQWFDFEVDPSISLTENRSVAKPSIQRQGANRIVAARTDEPQYKYFLEWENVRNDQAEIFLLTMLKRYKKYAILYDTEDSNLLNGLQVLHGIISGVRITRTSSSKCKVSLNFTEMIG